MSGPGSQFRPLAKRAKMHLHEGSIAAGRGTCLATTIFGAAALALVLCVAAGCGKNDGKNAAQDAAQGTFDPLKTFAPLNLAEPVNAYRSGDGTPGPSYWQNRADYTIHATLDTVLNQLSADEVITYTNNSPAALDCLWLQLDQNIYRRDSRARFAGGRAMDAVHRRLRARWHRHPGTDGPGRHHRHRYATAGSPGAAAGPRVAAS